jgi:hypothetical protein
MSASFPVVSWMRRSANPFRPMTSVALLLASGSPARSLSRLIAVSWRWVLRMKSKRKKIVGWTSGGCMRGWDAKELYFDVVFGFSVTLLLVAMWMLMDQADGLM